MPITIKCKVCGHVTRGLRDDMLGKKGHCHLCRVELDISQCMIHKEEKPEKLVPEKSNEDFLAVAKNVELAGVIISFVVAMTVFFSIVGLLSSVFLSGPGEPAFVAPVFVGLFSGFISWWFVYTFFSALACIIRILVSQKQTIEEDYKHRIWKENTGEPQK